jgi:membrane protein
MGVGMRVKTKEFVSIVKEAFRHWQAHKPTQRASSLAFLGIFPLPSLLMITAAMLSQIYGQAAALDQVMQDITTVAGPVVADLFRQVLENVRNPFATVLISVGSLTFFLLGSVVAFGELQDALNTIWDVVPPRRRTFKDKLRCRITPFLLISGLGIIIVIWTGVTAVVFSFIRLSAGSLAGVSILLGTADVALSFLLVALLFAVIYKMLPDTRIAWRDVALAAVLTAVLFTVSKYLFEIYIQAFVATSVYGVAGAIMLLLLWLFLVAQFLLFGAEFSNVYAERMGSRSDRPKSVKR